ncbi:MAG: MmgE/PrpD family protein [Proteobacteria bacterium]|nr:MmgE/PrpD family protein [Pseudomonadota bacterium]
MSEKEIEISDVMKKLAAYIAGASTMKLPEDAAEHGKHHLIDTIASVISGSRLHPGEMTIKYIRSLGGTKEALLLGTDYVTSAINAALGNAMIAHADETDDSHKVSRSHIGCGAVPAALAMAEREGSSGSAFLNAVVLGYDIGARTNFSIGVNSMYDAGHSTHTFAPTFGAAAAAMALAGLNADQVRWGISYTAQQVGGINCWQRDLDHIEKGFDFGGMAGRNGVTAATMVQAGFTGVDDVFVGPRNFYSTYSSEPRPEQMIEGLGERFEVIQTNIKKWTVGSPIQAPLDCIEELQKQHDLSEGNIKHIKLRLSDMESPVVNDRHMADICIQHMVALMVLDGTASFASAHDEERMQDPVVLAFRQKIELLGEPDIPRRNAIVEVTLANGEMVSHKQIAVRGTPENPMTRQEVDDKAYDLMAPIVGKDNARSLIDKVWEIEKVENVRDLRPLMMA